MKKSGGPAGLIRLLASTWRIHFRGTEPRAPAVLVFWHDEMLPVWKHFARRQATALTSLSKDGELLAQLLEDWEYKLVRGSSSSGGREALAQMESLARRSLVLVTPDGSRGPRHKMKPGAVVAAARAGVPLYCIRIRASGLRLQKSWDKFLIPWPFARVEIVISEPIIPPNGDDRDAVDRTIERAAHTLEQLTSKF